MRLDRLAIAVLPGLDHFVPDLARALRASGAVEPRVFPIRAASDLDAALAWTDRPDTDAIWFEFCWPPFPALIAVTDFARRRVIVRVHRIEAYETDHVARAPWEKVSDLVVVSTDMARCVREVRPDIDQHTRLHVIHNGIDTQKFSPPAHIDSGRDPFRVGWCGGFIARKNPTLALHVLELLRRHDTRYHLRLAVSATERLTMEAFCHQAATLRLAGHIGFDMRLAAAAMPAWHAANAVLLSTSLHESFGRAIAEAAACGCDIAVLDHVGAEEFWPAGCRFVTADRAASLVRAAQPGRYRDHVVHRFGIDREVRAVLALLGAERTRRAPGPDGSALYWEYRYRNGGTSGAGSHARLAAFKADILNRLVADHGVSSVLEFGCGDGRQLALARYPAYRGVDVSQAAVALCRRRFGNDPSKRFLLAAEFAAEFAHEADTAPADLVLSLDVVFHLVEDAVFEAHMRALFAHAARFVVIYASDRDERTADPHVRHRAVTAWVARHAPEWTHTAHIPNAYPHDPADPGQTSFSDFHVFARCVTT